MRAGWKGARWWHRFTVVVLMGGPVETQHGSGVITKDMGHFVFEHYANREVSRVEAGRGKWGCACVVQARRP